MNTIEEETKSVIEKTDRQKKTIKALGLKGVRHSVEQELTPQIEGMISKVAHLISVDKI